MENKTGRYFKYAVGEIVLVVIGILIALQINNWNEQRKEAVFEIQILKSFRESLETDLSDVDANIAQHKQGIQAADSILGLLNSSVTINEDSVSTLFARIQLPTRFVHSTSAFESLKSKGVNIISNDDLQKKIVDVYDSQYNFFLQAEQDFVDQIVLGWQTILPTRFEEGLDYQFTMGGQGSLKPLDFEALRDDQEFLYYLKTLRNHTKIFVEYFYSNLRADIVDLMEMIDSEIEEKERS
ncbi:DUF6090 family protein [Balneola sp. MJW-20]|uniref:DUF6090 family protein n=1 Tax=Gracilimonas aurantiaca TaxID=3234185 RepID=UPI003464FEE3